MEFKGTKVGWILSPNQNEFIADEHDNFAIAKAFQNAMISEDERKANAKLIAAAPEMLETILALCENLELQLSVRGCQTQSAALKSDADSYGGLTILEEARELIKKATEL